jgi:TorA maturation chaperone TorD
MTGASQVAASPDCEASAGTAAETLSGTAAETARERSGLYGFLAEVFRAEPTADLLHKIREPDFLDHLSAAGADPGADFPHRDEDDLIEDLAVEYARLFLGPGPHVHPYAAVYLAGEGASLWGPATAQFIAYSERAGLELASKHRSLPDHVSFEFEFMAKMAAPASRRPSSTSTWAAGCLDSARGPSNRPSCRSTRRWPSSPWASSKASSGASPNRGESIKLVGPDGALSARLGIRPSPRLGDGRAEAQQPHRNTKWRPP